jgi:simple sugar transport system ATP-binding protein
MSITVEARGITKSFGHVHALRGVDLTVRGGEIVALLGDNGAGKSTFVRILSGVHRADRGEVLVDGRPVTFDSTHDAQAAGVDVVYQDLALTPDLTVTQNVFLGRELPAAGIGHWFGRLDESRMVQETTAILETLAIKGIPASAPVAELSGGQRQAVAIARSLLRARTLLLMDEPTAALGARQSQLVCDAITRAADTGLALVVVSHDLERMLRVATRIVVLHRGVIAMDRRPEELDVPTIVAAMMGEAA